MTTQPRLSQLPLWRRHAETVLATLREALILFIQDSPDGDESALSRAFYFCILKANRERSDKGLNSLNSPPIWEARNQPSPDTLGASVENKIPDFQCGYLDNLEPDPERSAKYFVIECKRLGRRKSGHTLNSDYVRDGVLRFVHDEHRYGKDTGDGAMVGYIESMTPEGILIAVNSAVTANGLPPLVDDDVADDSICGLVHVFPRTFPISPFTLSHLWAIMSPPDSG